MGYIDVIDGYIDAKSTQKSSFATESWRSWE